MNKKILIIIICALFFVIVLNCGCIGDDKKDDAGNGQVNGNGNNNGVEPEPDLNLSISSDKTVYNSSETVSLTLTVINNMDLLFPFGDYSFGLFYVNKSMYDSGSFDAIYIFQDFMDLIKVEAGKINIYNINFNTTNVDSGDYYIQLIVRKADFTIEDRVICEITII